MNAAGPAWDVVIAGAGAMGAAAFYQLARRGARVLAIDRFAPPHDRGSSHGDTRITRLALGEGAHYVPFARRSHAIWRELEAATGATLLREIGCLVHGAARGRTPAHGAADFLQTTIQTARQHAIAHEVLDAEDLRERFPQFHWRDDDQGCLEKSGGYVRPEACILAQLGQALTHTNASLHTGEQVLQWRPDGEGIEVLTDSATYHTARLILSTGAWIGQIAPALRPMAKVHRQVLHWLLPVGPPALFTPEVMPAYIQVPDAGQAMFYGFPAIDGPTGGIKLATEQFADDADPDALTRQIGPQEIAAMHAIAAPRIRVSPHCVRSAVCPYTVTPDYHFIIDRHPEDSRVVLVSACSGHGFKHSAAVGEAAALLALDEEAPTDLAPFLLGRSALKTA